MVVRRIGEPAQGDPEVLSRLEAAGLRPGQRVLVRRVAGAVQVSGPKGVMIPHRAVVNYIEWMQRTFPLCAEPSAHPVAASG